MKCGSLWILHRRALAYVGFAKVARQKGSEIMHPYSIQYATSNPGRKYLLSIQRIRRYPGSEQASAVS
ncbi:hypothetical protein BDQ94DRAFT_149141, partial [Aspergillus welwitschiae]